MIFPEDDPSGRSDESFGPGTDLVVSLLAALLLLIPIFVRSFRLVSYLERLETVPADVTVLRTELEKCKNDFDARKQIWEFRETYRDEPLFERNRDGLTAAAKQQLDAKVKTFQDALVAGGYNQLLIEGHASPETMLAGDTRQRERWNLALSLLRSMAVADYLYKRGIPYECMSVAAFGRSHSLSLKSWLEEDPVRTVQDWDEGGRNLVDQIGEATLADERLVRVFGIRHEQSLCALSRRQ
ncbi:MAG TPA: OmpA family protein [Thermoanaerobaculia bacterium]|nr:OmpA family protein [Thermoanaerobaculia bacterium]